MRPPIDEHAGDCRYGDRCVECGGCDCGAELRVCTGPGCCSIDAHDEWLDENGYHESSYG